MIYALSLGKFLDVRKYACVKDLTNFMSEYLSTYECNQWWTRNVESTIVKDPRYPIIKWGRRKPIAQGEMLIMLILRIEVQRSQYQPSIPHFSNYGAVVQRAGLVLCTKMHICAPKIWPSTVLGKLTSKKMPNFILYVVFFPFDLGFPGDSVHQRVCS